MVRFFLSCSGCADCAIGEGRGEDQPPHPPSLRTDFFALAQLVLPLRHDPASEPEEGSQVYGVRLDGPHGLRPPRARLLRHVDGNGQPAAGRSQIDQQAPRAGRTYSHTTDELGFRPRPVFCRRAHANRGQAQHVALASGRIGPEAAFGHVDGQGRDVATAVLRWASVAAAAASAAGIPAGLPGTANWPSTGPRPVRQSI
jgi:hypothetical protein